MNKGKVIGGIVCLAVAALLAVLNLRLPEGNMVFMVGDTNAPWIPVAVLAVVGVALLATAGQRESADVAGAPEGDKEEGDAAPSEHVIMNKRLEAIGWGLFLIMLGGFTLVPRTVVHEGAWSIGVGLIMLGLNGARYFYGIRMSAFTTFLGILSLITGVAQLLGWSGLEGALFFIILGAYLLVKPWFDKRQLFGKVEQG
jgi:hypothetical protein